MCKDVMGRLPGSQSAVCTVKYEGARVCVCVCVKPKHCGEHYQPWTGVPFTQPALIMARWNSAQLFISCAALKIFPSCSSAVYNNILIPFICWVWFVQSLPGGNKFLCYNKNKNLWKAQCVFCLPRKVCYLFCKQGRHCCCCCCCTLPVGCRVDLVCVTLIKTVCSS